MGTCSSSREMRQGEANPESFVPNLQSDFQVKQPDLKCQSNFNAQYLCGNAQCKAEEAYYCGQGTCPTCPKNHDGCQNVKIVEITKLLRNRCDQHKEFVSKISFIENEMITEMKAQGKNRIQKMLLLGINPQQADVIEKLYFNKQNGDISQQFTADLLEQMKNSENVLTNEEKLLEQYRRDTERMLDKLKEMGQKTINRRTSQFQQQHSSSKVKQYGYADITNKLMRIPAHQKPKIKQIIINNTCTYRLRQAYFYDYEESTLIIIQCIFMTIKLQTAVYKGNGLLTKGKDFVSQLVGLSQQRRQQSMKLVSKHKQRQLQRVKYVEQVLSYTEVRQMLSQGKIDESVGQIKPFAEELSNFTNLQTIHWICSHNLHDEEYFKDVIEVINEKLTKLQKVKIQLPPNSHVRNVNDTWMRYFREGVEVELIREGDLKKKKGKV